MISKCCKSWRKCFIFIAADHKKVNSKEFASITIHIWSFVQLKKTFPTSKEEVRNLTRKNLEVPGPLFDDLILWMSFFKFFGYTRKKIGIIKFSQKIVLKFIFAHNHTFNKKQYFFHVFAHNRLTQIANSKKSMW